jgi:hypothetical protein
MSETEPRQLSVRTRFERFPATVKGAFILRGEDRDPHQVVFRGARVIALDGSVERPVGVPDSILDVAPHRDVFVPFEIGVSELEPGWYALRCDLQVDGVLGAFEGDRRFPVPWPRATLRRGPVKVGTEARLGEGTTVRVEQVESTSDSTRVTFAVAPPGPVGVAVSADGRRLPILSVELDEASGRGRVTAYPLLKSHSALRFEARTGGKGASPPAAIDIPLP